MSRKVVVTGIGIVSPNYIGSDLKHFLFNTSNSSLFTLKSEIENLEEQLEEHVPYKLLRRMCRFSEIALYSNILASKDAKLDIKSNNERIGSIMNTLYGPLKITEKLLNDLIKGGPQLVSPSDFANTVMNCATGQISMLMGLKGASTTLIGSSAITYAYDLIKYNKADALFVSGVDEFNTNIQKAIENENVDITENAICLLLEEYEYARNRNAKIYSEIISCGIGNGIDYGVQVALNEATKDVELQNKNVYGILSYINKEKEDAVKKEIHKITGDFQGLYECKSVFGETLGATELLSVAIGSLFEADKSFLCNTSETGENTRIRELDDESVIMSGCIQRSGCCSIIIQGDAKNV